MNINPTGIKPTEGFTVISSEAAAATAAKAAAAAAATAAKAAAAEAVIKQATEAVQKGLLAPISAAAAAAQHPVVGKTFTPVNLMRIVARTAPPTAAATTAAARIYQAEPRSVSAPPRLNTQAGLSAEENDDGSFPLIFEIEIDA